MVRAVALILTTLTGFSGLVYEVAWQRYLATLLGSHSEATSAVLGIFLGGLSVGYWLFGRVTRRMVERAEREGRPPRLLLLYGAIEGGIGLYVIAFPFLFRGVQAVSYALPHGAGGVGFAIDVGLSTLLIGPASVLMGGTIPILTQSLARSLEDATRFHAFVYAFNTIGAFAGALAAGFYLIPLLGIQNVMFAMGCINLVAGAIFVAVGRQGRRVIDLGQPADPDSQRLEGFGYYATIALLTGFAMMAVQTAVIRIGALSLGSSEFTFSMVVAVFVLAIALGSFAVSAFSRIPRMVIVVNQWGIGLLLLLLYPRLEEAPYWVMLVRSLFQDTNAAFYAYYLATLLLVLLAIGPAVILSGASLPLLFHHMRRQVDHLGDLAGYLYSWNTVGSLLGALLGGYAFFFFLDLHQVYRSAVAALFVAAAILTVRVYGRRLVVGVATAILLASIVVLPAWRPELLYSGLFRKRVYTALAQASGLFVGAEKFVLPHGGRFAPEVLFHTDDPTASVVVREHRHPSGKTSRSIATQGKNDGDTLGDYGTTGLLAVLPALLAEKAEHSFVIGWGVGSTAGELGTFDSMKEVHVAEISRGVMEAAPLFDFATENASKNPKITVWESDAYRALMRSQQQYDIIVSEPSHVWSAGVEMLFTEEFLRATKSRLTPGGVYCQFVHRYEMDDEAMALVLRTYSRVYDHVSIWHDVNQSLMLLGFNDDRFALDHRRMAARARRPDFAATLRRSQIPSFATLLAHELVPLGVINAIDTSGPVQSLYHPRLNHIAGKAFFRGDYAELPFAGLGEPAEIGARNSLLRRYSRDAAARMTPRTRAEVVVEACRALGPVCASLLAEWMSQGGEGEDFFEKTLAYVSQAPDGPDRERLRAMAMLFEDRSMEREAELDPASGRRLTRDFFELYHHASPFSERALLEAWKGCAENRPTEPACRSAVATRISVDPSLAEREEELVSRCLQRTTAGEACRAGANEAREALLSGAPPERRPRQGT